jgi:hypothetical protein
VRLLVKPGLSRSFSVRRQALSELAKARELHRQAAENLEILETL